MEFSRSSSSARSKIPKSMPLNSSHRADPKRNGARTALSAHIAISEKCRNSAAFVYADKAVRAPFQRERFRQQVLKCSQQSDNRPPLPSPLLQRRRGDNLNPPCDAPSPPLEERAGE